MVGDRHNHPDGMFGNGTSGALEDYLKDVQAENKLPVTGEYDDATREALVQRLEGIENPDFKESLNGLNSGTR